MADLKISQLTAYTTPLDADVLVVNDTANATTKKTTWANIKATLKTYLDTLYSPVFTTSAGLASLLSDETGSSGGVVVFSASPTIVTPTIASMANAQHNHTNAAGGGQITDAALSTAVGVTKGGTGQTSANAGLNALLPSQTSNGGKVLQSDGTNTSWAVKSSIGGTGADGALSISSGTTTIDCSGAKVVVKNYTSISITGTGKLAFSNPHANGTVVFLLSQGAVTLTSSTAPMIDMSAMGALGTTGATTAPGTSTSGSDGTKGQAFIFESNGGVGSSAAAIGAGGAISTTVKFANQTTHLLSRYADIFTGAGGGGGHVTDSGGGGTITGGTGGKGGGALIIECAGAFNFTTASGISVAGENGGSASGSGGANRAGGGGGGAGGYCRISYAALTANSGTITVSGGTGGNTFITGGAGTGYGGGGGGNPIAAGSSGTSSASSATKVGGDGASGYSSVLVAV